MKLEIHSFEGIRRRAKAPFPPRTVLVSIGDPDTEPPQLDHMPDHMLRLTFDDITPDLARSWLNLDQVPEEELETVLAREHNTVLFTKEMAREAARFIRAHIRGAALFICQCEFGQSRSAALAAAIAEHYFRQGSKIFANPRYSPNPLVYERVLEALGEEA